MFDVNAGGYAYTNKFDAATLSVINDPAGRTLVSRVIDPSERTFVAVIEGQSLAGNRCTTIYQPTRKVHVVNVLGGKQVYEHEEPMMGASMPPAGGYGSIWGKVGDLLIDGDVFDRVIWCNVSYGGATAADLAPSGILGHRITLAFRTLRMLGIAPTAVDAVLTMHGENDNIAGTAKATYKTLRFETIQAARDFGYTGPWFIAKESYSGGAASTTIQDAQTEMVGTNGVVAGPNIDSLGAGFRYDTVHITAPTEPAGLWFDVLEAYFA